MRGLLGRYLLPIVAAGMLVFAVLHVVRAQQSPPNPPPPIEPARTPFGKTIAGAGIVEPNTENISVGSPLPGVIWEMYFTIDDVGKPVKKGQPLFKIDDRQLQAQLAYYQANVTSAQAQLTKLELQPRPEEVPPVEAQTRYAEAQMRLNQDLANRNIQLVRTQSVTEEETRQRTLTYQASRHQLEQARAQEKLLKLGAWKPDKDIAAAAVAVARAQIKQTETDIERSIVRSPVDGQLLQVNVRLYEYVTASSAQTLMIVGNTTPLYIRVDIDEHDVPRAFPFLKKDGTATASPRGDPSKKYPLHFVRVEPYVIPKKSLTGDNTERVDTRVLQVIYRVEGDAPGLFVGMQMDVFLDGDALDESAQKP